MDQLQSHQNVLAEIERLAGSAPKIVFVSGNFNIVHPGHLRLLQFAAECGNFLVVGVNGDGASGTTLTGNLRLEGVRAISFVNFAFMLHEPSEAFIACLRPAVVVKGKEHEGRDNPEQSVVESYGGKLLFSSGEVRFSSLELLRKEYLETNFSTIRKPADFAERHRFTVPGLKSQLGRFNGMRVMVIGDLIVDEYINCDALGMSQEDPTLVVTPIESKQFVGGAGIVAAHAQGLGADTYYLTVAGEDKSASFAAETLASYGVTSMIVDDDSRPTTLKQRFRAAGKTLLRVSHLRQHDIRPDIAKKIQKAVEKRIRKTDLIIFADFNYGCLPQGLVDYVIQLGTQHGIPMAADSQASSQMSNVARFRGMKLLTPTEREARLALRDSNSGLVVVAETLRAQARAENVIVTLGSEGILLHAKNSAEWITDRLPAFNIAPKDSAGAGDCLLTCTAMALCSGLDIWQSVYLGSIAAACQVGRVGNTPLTQAELILEIDYL
jgi:rfaE bifunctional protein kinase chain/domain